MTNAIISILGWAGAGVLLLAYALVSTKRLTGDGWRFQVLNLAGGLALAVNSAFFGAWPSAVLNIVWVAIGAVTIARIAAASRRPVTETSPPAAEAVRPTP
ncbi:hypothetical protein J2S43_006362 [Catenuloplanes nepalensis]|uniref:CBU-0592-like domain-containing protein n=1 Tax=Catenuloplanes nepalensis TaxID=587533 RepID=A0ABT9N2N7_9ACTN|nr:hypothetical protein [Catenuloplanes nepalensis]MDP9797850.1 hypothetical protein [Catenuloplanes nepalensis]